MCSCAVCGQLSDTFLSVDTFRKFPAIAITYLAGSRLHQPGITCDVLADCGSRLLPG